MIQDIILYQNIKRFRLGPNIIFDPNVSFNINNKTYKGYARIFDKSKEPILANTVSDLMFSKYRWNDGLIVELTSKDNSNDNKHIIRIFKSIVIF
ncbi:MAG: hypothetical protein ACR2F1_01590 [Nitrososphaeraceae archaeon]